MTTGIIRNLDELGRIVIPIEIRKRFGLGEKDPLEARFLRFRRRGRLSFGSFRCGSGSRCGCGGDRWRCGLRRRGRFRL